MMKKKFNNALAASICFGVMAAGSAQADSLLAPLVISDSALGFETLFSIKVRGNGTPNARMVAADQTDLHYTYLRKGNNIGSLFNLGQSCHHENGNGRVSSWDMINHTINPANQWLADPFLVDNSVAFTPATPFYGMAVIDDVASLNTAGNSEGNSSGFAYVMNYFTGMMLDYKLLNNHRSTVSGKFDVGFTRKTSVDLAWNPLLTDATVWLGVATGAAMTQGNSWAGSITISQATNTALGNVSPTIPHNGPSNPAGTGVYNNDEVNFSGDTPVNITCMGLFTRNDFLDLTQEQNTRFGGWTRKSIIGDGTFSQGGLVYKAELKWIPSFITNTTQISFQPETSGHLSPSGSGPHPNRPF